MRFFTATLVILFLLPSGRIAAQNYQSVLRHYGVEDGLSHREVVSIFQDSDGFMWLGTRFGLNRFDGYSFKSWTLAQYGVNFNDISSILQDDAGWLWLYNGDQELIFLHPKTGEIQTIRERFRGNYPFKSASDFWTDPGNLLMTDSTSRLHFIMSRLGIEYTYHSTEGFRQNTLQASWQSNTVFSPISTNKKLYYGPQKSRWQLEPDGWHISGPDGQLQVKLLRKEHPDHVFDLRSIYTDRQGHVWLGSNFGLTLVDIQSSNFQQYFSFSPLQEKPFNNSARGIWANESAVYINTEYGGLVTMPRHGTGKEPPWRLLTNDRNNPEMGGYRRPLWRDTDGSFWTGTARAFLQMDSTGRVLNQYTFDRKFLEKKGIPDFWSIYRDIDGRFWLGNTKGLAYKDPGDPMVRNFEGLKQRNESVSIFVLNILEDRERNIWLCTNHGLYLLDKSRNNTTGYGSFETGDRWLPAENFQYIYQDKEGIYWLATAGNGLLRWDKQAAKVERMTHMNGLSSDNIYAIYEDNHHRLWLSSDHGIMQLDKLSRQVHTYLPKDGLAQEEFNRIAHFQAPDGTIFFGGLNGVTAFQPNDFYPDDGLPKISYPLRITSFQQFDSRLNQLIDRTAELLKHPFIVIQPDDRFFQLEFALLAYENVEKIRYAWKIEGLDEDWNYQKERSIRLSRLPYGKHVLRIKAQMANGKWSSSELALPVHVIQPYYLTNWFLLLLGLTLLIGGYSLYEWRLRWLLKRQVLLQDAVTQATNQIQQDKKVIEEQAAELRQLDAMKSRFFANVSHDLRTPLTLILGPAEHLLRYHEQMTSEQREISLRHLFQNGSKLLSFVEELMELSRLDAQQVQLQQQAVVLFPYCQRIFSVFELKGRQKEIDYSLDYQMEPSLCVWLDPGRLEKILNNLLANALQYTQTGGLVKLQVLHGTNNIQFSVHDTGPGIHPEELPFVFDRYFQGKRQSGAMGIGLALARELSLLMDGQLSVQSELGSGTVITLVLPEERVSVADTIPFAPDNKFEEQGFTTPDFKPVTKNDTAPTILVVEDNVDLQEHLKIILGSAFQVVLASDGVMALKVLENQDSSQEAVQLILSDIMMPEMDGFELLGRIKNHPRWRDLPVILLTARNDEADRLQGLRLGVDDYLTKPFSSNELLARIHNLLARYQERRQYAKPASGGENDDPTEISADARWLEQLQVTIRESLSAPDSLSVTQLAARMLMSPRTFQRQIKQLTGLSPNQYIMECRLDRGRQLLENRVYRTVREVAIAVGLTPHYFSAVYLQRYGRTPGSYFEES